MHRLRGDRWIALEWKLQDAWVGAFWDWRKADYYTARGHVVQELHVWVCLIPCVPIHYIAAWRYERDKP